MVQRERHDDDVPRRQPSPERGAVWDELWRVLTDPNRPARVARYGPLVKPRAVALEHAPDN